MKKFIVAMTFLSALFGCKSNRQELIELTSKQEEGWQDLILTITDKVKQKETGYWALKCMAQHKKDTVGLRIYILDDIEPGIVDNDFDGSRSVKDAVHFESIGKESDKFVKVVSELFGQPIQKGFTSQPLKFTVFPLNRKKGTLETGYFKFKLFFDDLEELGLYSELYLNPNLPEGTVEINEKDEEYRENLIKAFSQLK